jgi:hypothetical protein
MSVNLMSIALAPSSRNEIAHRMYSKKLQQILRAFDSPLVFVCLEIEGLDLQKLWQAVHNFPQLIRPGAGLHVTACIDKANFSQCQSSSWEISCERLHFIFLSSP